MNVNLMNYINIRHLQWILVLSIIVLNTQTKSQSSEEGDPCETKRNESGICTKQSKCNILEQQIKNRITKVEDVVSCGFSLNEEVICCPNKSEKQTIPDLFNTSTDFLDLSLLLSKSNDNINEHSNTREINNRNNQQIAVQNSLNQFENLNVFGLSQQKITSKIEGKTRRQIPTKAQIGGVVYGFNWLNIINPDNTNVAIGNNNNKKFIYDEYGNKWTVLITSDQEKENLIIKQFPNTPSTNIVRKINKLLPVEENHLENGHPNTSLTNKSLTPDKSNISVVNPETTSRINITNPSTIISKERPAVRACQEIEENLEKSLTPHILNGVETDLGQFPHMAAIGYTTLGNDNGPYEYACAGSLIHKKFVLTAAHCVVLRDRKPAIVLLGVVDISNKQQLADGLQIRINRILEHENYLSNFYYDDIALLELLQEIDGTKSTTIYPACLYTDLKDPPVQNKLYVTGWGVMNLKLKATSKILLKAELSIVDLNNCQKIYKENVTETRKLDRGVIQTQMCAHDPNGKSDACNGDSGGPLNFVKNEDDNNYSILGIISVGVSCATRIPSLYTRVAAYLDWIESIVWPELI